MNRTRKPLARAIVSGATERSRSHYEGRTTPKRSRPIGEPYAGMTDEQKAVWHELVAELPWLHSAHRVLLRLTCYQAARLNSGEDVGVSATQALSSLLSKLGATPVDESRLNLSPDDAEEDPLDALFTRRN